MKAFMGGKQSIIGGATKKIALIGDWEKDLAYVVGSNQSNFTPVVFGSDGQFPLREATRTVFPFDESSGVMRLDTLPVPPVKSMLLFEDMILSRWVDRL
jgi:hypothetical protein